jgi:hypothetical protein
MKKKSIEDRLKELEAKLSVVNDADFMLRGRKEIMAFMKIKCWRTIQRWQKNYGLPIMIFPNERPMALRFALVSWLIKFNRIWDEHKKDGTL